MKIKEEINIGDKFNSWTVLAEAPKRGVNDYFQCKCVCGVEREVFRGSLLGGRSKSCGCKAREGRQRK